MKIIPIVFSSSDYYVPYLAVTLQSLISNGLKDYSFEIFILHKSITEYNSHRLKRLENDRLKINFINMLNYHDIPKICLEDERYYRLFAPELLSQYDKLIYLDSDLVVLGDISKLYETDIEGKILGAVGNYNDRGSIGHIEACLDILPQECINTGVLLINTKIFNGLNIKEKCLELLNKIQKPEWADQDLLNVVCRENVKKLDDKWNFQCHAIFNKENAISQELKELLAMNWENSYIIHYSGMVKPWEYPNSKLANYFWKYARNTEFYEEILFRNNSKQGGNCFAKYIFPFDKVKKGSSVILYGAGSVGTAYYDQIGITSYCKIISWHDKDYAELNNSSVRILPPAAIKNIPCDFVVIGIENLKVREEVRKYLIEIGISEKTIISEEPINEYK